MKKTLIFLLSLCFLLVGCSSPPQDANAALREFTAAYGTLPMGNYYSIADGSIDKARVLKLYDPDGHLSEGKLLDAALYLGSSFDEVFELAVFDCAGSDAAIEVAELCHRRAELLKTFDKDLEYTVIQYGEYLFFAAMPSVTEVKKIANSVFH
jgi:hypothetical protein